MFTKILARVAGFFMTILLPRMSGYSSNLTPMIVLLEQILIA
jgi:hypothetical protein